MIVLLDIDGVLVTTPSWRKAELEVDGFLKFDERAVNNLAKLICDSPTEIVLTTTHRINYSVQQWQKIFQVRGINPDSISIINQATSLADMSSRANEIRTWFEEMSHFDRFVIIDDDTSLNGLPTYLKDKCVLTKPLIGFDDEAAAKARNILLGDYLDI